MNSSLNHHFSGINDEKYRDLKNQITEGIEVIQNSKNLYESFLLAEQVFAKLDYLITYVKNILRMGFIEASIDNELKSLYETDNKLCEITAEIRNSLSDEEREKLTEYSFYLEKNEKLDNEEVTDEPDSSMLMSLEKYQSIITHDSLSDFFLKDSDKNESEMNDEIKSQIDFISDLFMAIKQYQIEHTTALNFETPLCYIADRYTIDYESLTTMVNGTADFGNYINEVIERYREFGYSDCFNSSEILNFSKLNAKSFTFEEAMRELAEIFSTFSPDFGEMILRALNDSWIDYENRDNKLSGSYTNIIPFRKESLISMAFDGSVSDVCKIAHEIGHAYHGFLISENTFFNTDFSVITAEMFGLFCENYALIGLACKYMDEADESLWKKEFYFNVLRTLFTNLLAFNFENKCFEILISGEKTNPTEIYSNVMTALNIGNYTPLSKYKWIFRSHNFFPSDFYYNFVYVIGEISALNLLKDLFNGSISNSDIKEVLIKSGTNTVDKLFGSIGIDLNNTSIYDLSALLDEVWSFVK